MMGTKNTFENSVFVSCLSAALVKCTEKSPVWSASLFSCPFAGNTARMRSSFLHVFLQSYTILSLAIFLLHDESTLGSRRLPFYTKVDYKFSFLK